MMENPLDRTWLMALENVLQHGKVVSPRGMRTVEVLHATVAVEMRRPVLTVPARKLNYRFMAAEAYWILSGDDSVANIAPWNQNISKFSDDGKTFFGAYGPKVVGQLDYVVNTLLKDGASRQAVITIWRENPPRTKDVPCTISFVFSLRENKLNVHAFMRSSDLWLGLPYDAFNFSMLGHLVCARLNYAGCTAFPNVLYLTAVSSHLYETNWADAGVCLRGPEPAGEPATPELLYTDEATLMRTLGMLRDSQPGSPLRWWERRS